MRALSLKQPWLYAITDLDKRVENRTWPPPRTILGQRIALHASQVKSNKEWIACEKIHGKPIPRDVPTGAIVATAKIDHLYWNYADMEVKAEIHWDDAIVSEAEAALTNKWFFGPYGWHLFDVFKLKQPLPCKGMLGLWQVSDELEHEIEQQLKRRIDHDRTR